jgi:hypothetical protein
LNQVTATRLGKHDDILDVLCDAFAFQVEETKDMVDEGAPEGSIEYLFQNGLHPTVAEQNSPSYNRRRRQRS